MIVDAFIFYNELDLLEMRLIELDPVVDKFVIVQAHQTFRGDPKPLYLSRHDRRWQQYSWKIETVNVDLKGSGPWEREKYQRNVISDYVKDLFDEDDVVIISDVDEIPRREIVRDLAGLTTPVALNMKHYNYGLNCRYPGPWFAAKALRVRDLTTAEEVRQATFPIIEDAGWHFSYFGDDEFISQKFRSFSHSEVDTPLVHGKIEENRKLLLDPHNHGQQLTVEKVWLEEWPHAVAENPKYWSKYIA